MNAAPTGAVDLSFVVPAFNEAQRLGPTLDAVTRYLGDEEGRWGDGEVVVADDGSTDTTRDLVTTREDPRIRLVAGPRRGKGAALRLGVADAEVPVHWSHQPGSKVRPLDYVRVLAELARLRARTLRPADGRCSRAPTASYAGEAAKEAWRLLLKGVLIAAAVCLPIVAYPLAWQFAGPQSYSRMPHGDSSANSPLALLSFAERSLIAGNAERANDLSSNPTEQNAFYGWPLALLAFAIVVRQWENALVKALAFTAIAAALLTLGTQFRIPMTDMEYPGPWALLADKPLFESVIESRVAMICAPALGMLLALALERLLATRGRGTQYLGLMGVSLALLPLVPAPLKTVERAQTPAFFTDGAWKPYVRAGEALVTVPLPDAGDASPCTGRSRRASASGSPAATSTAPGATTASASTAPLPVPPRAC